MRKEIEFLQNKDLLYKEKRKEIYPRIELSTGSSFGVLLHELGHYFMYKRNQTQSEDVADAYIEEFFDSYLPPFFKWIFQTWITVYAKKELKFTEEESFMFWKDYQNFFGITNEIV